MGLERIFSPLGAGATLSCIIPFRMGAIILLAASVANLGSG
jgi:hypothetical protein